MVDSTKILEFGKVRLLDRILIAELNEGVLFDVPSNRTLLEIGTEAFNNAPYGYISHRVNSYAVNPMVYLESANAPNLRAIAVVTTDNLVKQNATIEQQFYKNKSCFGVFATLEEAIDWIKEKIRE
ncbi:MAG: hypothetical protein WCD31_13545 [Gillisia sp.]